MQFSSKPQFNDDPAPYVVTLTKRTPFTNPMTTGSMDEFVREDGRLHAPRPEFDRPQHNPTNRLLAWIRPDYNRDTPEGWSRILEAVAASLGYTVFEVQHARRVLTRLAAVRTKEESR